MSEEISAEDTNESAGLLRAFLAGRNVACPHCEYNLRDLTGNRCPECGEELVLRLNLAEPKLAAVIAGLIALSAGAGLHFLLLIYAAIVIIGRGRQHFFDRFVVVNILEFAVEGALLGLWLRAWRKIRRAQTRTRWWLVAGCCAVALIDIVVFSATIH